MSDTKPITVDAPLECRGAATDQEIDLLRQSVRRIISMQRLDGTDPDFPTIMMSLGRCPSCGKEWPRNDEPIAEDRQPNKLQMHYCYPKLCRWGRRADAAIARRSRRRS